VGETGSKDVGANLSIVAIVPSKSDVTEDQLKELLDEAGVKPDEVHCIDENAEFDEIDLANCTMIVVLDQQVLEDENVYNSARACGVAGAKVIVLIGDGFDYQDLHPLAKSYGTQCGWSAKAVSDAIIAPSLAEPAGQDGSQLQRPKPRQVDC